MSAVVYYREFREAREELLRSKGALHLLFNLRYPLQAFKNWQDVAEEFLPEEQPLLVDAKTFREVIGPALRLYYKAYPYPPASATDNDVDFSGSADYKMSMAEAKQFHERINGDGKFAMIWGSVLTYEEGWDDGISIGPATSQSDRLIWKI